MAEEVVGVRVRSSRARRFLIGAVFVASLLAGAAAAVFYSGKSDVILKPALSLWQSVRGK